MGGVGGVGQPTVVEQKKPETDVFASLLPDTLKKKVEPTAPPLTGDTANKPLDILGNNTMNQNNQSNNNNALMPGMNMNNNNNNLMNNNSNNNNNLGSGLGGLGVGGGIQDKPEPTRATSVDKYSDVARLREQLKAAEMLESRAKKQTNEYRIKVEEMETKVKEANEKVESMMKQSQLALQEATFAKQAVAPLQQQNQELHKVNIQWKEENEKQKQEIEKLHETIDSQREDISKTKDFNLERESLTKRLEEAEQRAMKLQEEKNELQRELFQIKRERDALKEDINIIQKQQGGNIITSPPAEVKREPGPIPGIALDAQIYPVYKKGDQVVRKGEVCTVTKIDKTIDPPGIQLKVNSSGIFSIH
eukprot:UN33583